MTKIKIYKTKRDKANYKKNKINHNNISSKSLWMPEEDTQSYKCRNKANHFRKFKIVKKNYNRYTICYYKLFESRCCIHLAGVIQDY